MVLEDESFVTLFIRFGWNGGLGTEGKVSKQVYWQDLIYNLYNFTSFLVNNNLSMPKFG